MKVGLVGAGNIARALARGWGEPVLCTDSGSGRAQALVAEVGGQALTSNAEMAERADLIVLCHKPSQLDVVAAQIGRRARAVASVLAATPVAALQAAYPGIPVFRLMPNTPVEVRMGIVCYTAAEGVDPGLQSRVIKLFGRLGSVIELDEGLIDTATAVMGCGPAYVALVTEAQVDAAVRHGLPAPRAAEMVVGTLAGTAELMQARDRDAAAVRGEVTSPGGLTERGVAALERGGLRAAFDDAFEAVLGGRSA